MEQQQLLTIFIAITSVAVLIQTGILIGVYVLTLKLTRQANRAVEHSQLLFGPMNQTIDKLQTASSRLAAVTGTVQGRARDLHSGVAKAQTRWRETLDRWVGIGA